MKIRNLVGAMVALVGITFAGAALGDGGDILGVWPCDKYGTALDAPISSPVEPWNEKTACTDGKAYFKVRFLNRNYASSPHPWAYVKVMPGVVRDLAVGVLVSGVMKEAYCEGLAQTQGDRYTDFIFSYLVEPGDLALPMMLSNENGKPFGGDDAVPLKLYWTGNYSIQDAVTGETANWWWSSESSPLLPERNADYDLTQAGIFLKTFDFDRQSDEKTGAWRRVPEKSRKFNALPTTPTITVPWTTATNSTSTMSIFLWSENEDAFTLTNGFDVIKLKRGEVESGVTRTIAELKIQPGKESYKFNLWGVESGRKANIVMAATDHYVFNDAGAYMTNFLTRAVVVDVAEPPSVTLAVADNPVTATKDWEHKLTEISVEFSEGYGEDVEIEIVPEFTGAKGTHEWYDYLRFAASPNEDVTLQGEEEYTNFPRVVILKNELKPSKLNGHPLAEGGKVYVYGLYGDAFSNGGSGKFTVKPVTTNEHAAAGSAAGGIDGWGEKSALAMKAADPELSSPVSVLSANIGKPRDFEINVADVYFGVKGAEGYRLYTQNCNEGVDPEAGKWTELEKDVRWRVDANGVLTNGVGKLPSLKYSSAKTYVTWFYVQGPNGQTSGMTRDDALAVTVKVSPAPEVSARISTDDETWVTNGKFKENTQLYVNFDLSVPRESGDDKPIYAFLAPKGDAAACVSGDALTNTENAVGVEIRAGETTSDYSQMFTVVDGTRISGTKLTFDIVLCESETYDPAKVIDDYQSRGLTFQALNVIPKLTKVTLDRSYTVTEDGGTPTTKAGVEAKVPLGVEKEFVLTVDEPGTVDKTIDEEGKKFKIDWGVVEANGRTDGGTLYGNPKNAKIAYTFTGDGRADFTVTVEDKDMEDDPNADEPEEFTFYVNVTAKAAVTITTPETVGEDMSGYSQAPIDIALSDFGNHAITTKVTVVHNETTEKDRKKLGFIRIGGAINTDPLVDADGNEYYLVCLSGGKARLFVDEADGTDLSNRKGFTLKAAIVDSGTDPVTGKAWSECYEPSETIMYVANVEPQLVDCSLGATILEGNTNAVKVGIGEVISVDYRVDDVMTDVTNGIKVQWWDTDNKNAAVTNVYDSTNTYYFTTKFKNSGPKTIRVTLTDKDSKPTYVGEWNFLVESTKTLITVANGPSAGVGNSTLSQRYSGAKGAGEGHVWSDASFAFADTFQINWNCNPSTMSANVFGWGYKTNAVDNGTLDSETIYQHDIPLSPKGNNTTESGKSALDDYYKYAGAVDSFLYGWIYHTMGEGGQGGGSSGLTSTLQGISPERTLRGAASASAPLPNSANNGKAGSTATVTYPTVYMEAVFAKEYLPSDNMGDINADGIPDLYLLVSDYEFGIVDPTTGELTGNDLRDLNFTEGEDPEPYCLDYLPTTETEVYSHLIPGLPESWAGEAGTGKPFIPRLKIRGFDETDSIAIATRGGISASALNDAPTKWAGVAGVKPDQIYTNPREDAASTLNYVEWLAWSEFKAAHPTATEKDWSPERPTNPTRKDTDGDGLTDGYEYYFWYMAHVGYIDEDGVHRYLTGRAYNPRNPGDGDFIDSETLANAFDPQNPTSYKLRDTDNDGLPDELEFLIGTNPIDFDTDGDGLPDGFEIMLGGTDPLLAETTRGVSDAMRNFDGDAMAFTSPFYEKTYMAPKPLKTDMLYTFALVDADGDTDGVQWYVGKAAPPLEDLQPLETCVTGTSFTVGEKTYVTREKVPLVDGRLAADLDKMVTWEVLTRESLTNSIPSLTNLVWIVDETNDVGEVIASLTNATDFVALMPTRFAAGTEVGATNTATYATLKFAEDVTGVNAAWTYGRSVTAITTGDSLANIGGFGMLAIGRYKDAPKGVQIAALPAEDENVAYLHHFVYQEFGFDPRTAWNANTPLAPRWGKTVGEGDSKEVVANNFTANYGYAGVSVRTREYTLYDEFLVMSFFLNNGKLTMADVTATQAFPWEKIWAKYTTNGQGPNEPNWEEDNEHFKGRTAETNSGENGADTDLDGVPDGWELYVMAGPKVEDKETKEFKYNLAAPYNDGFYSSFGPFVKDAAKASVTDNSATGGNASTAGDGDGLTELQEYAGTDSCAYYSEPWGGNEAPFSTTIVRPAEHKDWLNKFFPTDPWNKDTDGDGLGDSAEAGKFKYGKPVDDGKRCAISGGGLNPCTVDTDMDGLPDGWEAQFAGKTVYAGADAQKPKDKDGNEVADGNVLQGYCDGMDGTVFDAYTSPRIKTSGVDSSEEYVVSLDGVAQVVDRDYDKDGLENWQEYLTGAMRCWRYDDPITVWDYVPDAAFFNPMTGEFDLAAAMRHTGIKNVNEFWYRLLFDTKSKWYNPHFVTASTPSSQYFSRVTNGWDQVFSEAGTYYMFYDRRNGDDLKVTWGKDYYEAQVAPTKYIGTSPIDADTDQDGMDDGYELFHGLNPLLGAVGVLKSSNGPCDIVFDAWYVDGMGSPVNAIENLWIKKNPGNGKYDFIAHPWLNGLVDADPDGDDIRNQDEAIMPLVAPHSVWLHTDPTPLWMTDSSYGDSIVSRFFRLPSARGMVPVPESIVFDGQEYSLIDCDGYMVLPLIGPVIAPFLPDYWSVTGEGAANWAYSFEENEGFDTDHDSSSDFEEKQGKFRNATDPQDADSPRRRQAMYFPGQNAALQSMPFVSEVYPRAAMGYPDDMSFLQYTVECWVRPEAADPAKVYTVLERTSFTDPSHVADERYVRRNFAIQIRNGKWSTAFDTNGTLDDSIVEVIGKTDVKVGEWTHVAATYDANRLTLYVNGNEDGYVLSSLKPEYGSSAVITYPAGSGSVNTNDLVVDGSLEALKGTAHAYWFDSEYAQYAFLIGASFRNASDGDHLDVTKHSGWGRYKEFFKGYVDEVRVWDGAQPADVVFSHFSTRKRFTREDALENRSSFYKQWVDGRRRYSKDGDGLDHDVTPELRFHWAFDSIPGAENAAEVAQAPHGFLEGSKPSYSRPSGYRIPWWSGIVGAYGSVYEGERNWVPWIPNTVTHLPRLDMTTLDSAYWSENYAGDKAGTYKFARTAEPVSKWTQYVRNETDKPLEFRTTGRRFWLTHNTGTNATSTLPQQFEFTGRHLNQTGDDLLPLGGAFAKYVDVMWDDQGASSMWEQTGLDDDGDGLPNWWQEYVNQNCREGVPEGTDITWDTLIWYEIGGERVRITAGEAYKRDLAKGVYRDANGEIQFGPTDYAQTAKSDGLIPDWWKELRKIDGEQPLADLDNDGLNNYVEYVASELLPFRLNLDPRMAKSDTKTLDYFRKVGRLYLGEMLTDHDQMEDHWERSLGDESVASAALWDALKDGEKDGWCNFAENRYNGYSMSILAQLVAHAMGDNEVLDAPIPSIKMKVRYNGDRPLAASSEGGGTGNDDTEKSDAAPALVVRAFSKSGQTGDYVMNPDAVWTVTPGVAVDRETYLGGWEDRVVRGTLAPGYVDLGSVNILFAQVPQNDLYSWTDESGTHLAGTYKEFKEAFDKNPNIIQNIQNFEWLSLYAPMNEYTSADKAVTVTRDGKLQENARFAVYGEPVGTINLSTGDFEFDMGAMNKLRVNYTYDGSKGPAAAWSYKEAIFKIVYTAKVPSTQLKEVDFSLAKADKGFVRGGLNSFEAFYDLNGNGAWDPGEPFGVANDVEIGWAGRDVELELTDMSAITPRVKLWGAGGESSGGNNGGGQEEQTGGRASAADSDRGVRVGTATFEAGDDARFEVSTAPAPKSRVRVVRYKVDKFPAYKVGVDAGVVLEKDFEETSRDFLHEGDFLADGDLDIDWKNLYTDVVDWQGAQLAACEVTNVTYLIVYNWDKSEYASDKDTNTQVRANATLVTRRFEVTRTVPTPCPERAVYNQSRPVFAWKIAGEDKWASWFGTTYTAFKVRVKDLKGNLVYDSGVRRLPAMDSEGVYTWAPPLYVGEKAPGSAVIFQNLTDYTWEVAVYNAKFKTDTLYAMEMNDATGKKVFSTPLTFRMNVTKLDTGSAALAVRACYTGPAAGLLDCVRVQAFASPDFTGDPVAETTIRYVDIRDSLSPEGSDANAKLVGLPAGSYFLRAYIDTNRNGVHDEWESWGYLNERDQASKPGIFNPVALAASINPAESNVRKIFIEDCDTDGDWFPDVWEAEQNGGVFVKFKNGAGQGPVTGNAELIGVNTNLDANLDVSAFPMLEALSSKAGLALISGIPPTRIRTVERSDGTLGIQVDNTVTSVKVTKLDFDADGNVSIQIDAATVSGGLDEGLSKFYGTSLDKTMTVTCIVYRKAKLTDANWAEAGREVVTVGGDEPTTVKVSKPVAGNAGFYMVKIVQ